MRHAHRPLCGFLTLASLLLEHAQSGPLQLKCPVYEAAADDCELDDFAHFCINYGYSNTNNCYCLNTVSRSCSERCDSKQYPDLEDCQTHCSKFIEKNCVLQSPPVYNDPVQAIFNTTNGLLEHPDDRPDLLLKILIPIGIIVVIIIFVVFFCRRRQNNAARRTTATPQEERRDDPVQETSDADQAAKAATAPAQASAAAPVEISTAAATACGAGADGASAHETSALISSGAAI